MRIGFVNNQIDNRGTGNAIYDYAHYNEEILGNESLIFALYNHNLDEGMRIKLSKRFTNIYSGWDLVTRNFGIDVIYHIKSGEDDGSFDIKGARYAVHAVFNASQPHGDRYATISRWMADKYRVPFVPHIVRLAYPTTYVRHQYHIPKDAFVFGRHGGADTFDLPWVWGAINQALTLNKKLYFLFLNTDYPSGIQFTDPSRVIFIPATADDHDKSSFIHACDAMLHARQRGETFGISVGEFAVAGKPVLTYDGSGERAHIDQLGSLGWLYNEENILQQILNVSNWPKSHVHNIYDNYTPSRVMQQFKEIFLDE